MTTPAFTHLHVHSHYSLLDGLGQIHDIFQATKDQGMDSIALTDHGVLYGAIEWFQKAKDYGVKPIIGLEGYISPNRLEQKRHGIDTRPYHVTLIAKNEAGYKNLIKLVTIAHLQGYYYKPRFDYETLAKHSEGLIALSGCIIAHIPREIISGNIDKATELIRQYQKIFGKDNFYLEVQHHPKLDKQNIVNEKVYEFAKSFEVPLVATNDVHFVHKEDEPVHDILLCVQTGKKVHETDRMSYVGAEVHLKSPEEMFENFSDHTEALTNTQRIAEQCSFEVELGKLRLPKYPLPEETTPDAQLRKLCEEGGDKRYGKPWAEVTKEAQERLDYELGIIDKMGFAGYFLIVQDFVNWAKGQGIVVGPGRGSAAGSLVSYLLGITDVDPLKWGLFFERFLNPARVSMPDIDMDFDDERRDEVIEYVAKKYGRDKVAQIITFGTIKARAGIRDAGRVLDIPYSFCDTVAKMIPLGFNLQETLDKVPEFKKLYNSDPQAKKLIDAGKRMEGVARHASTHACGVVISNQPLSETVPTQYSTRGSNQAQSITTQYSLHPIEDLGLLKMDFLGLSNLTIIRHALDLIEKQHGTRIDISNLPLDDGKTFDLLKRAQTIGVFQLESSGMRRYLRDLKPNELEDIVSMVALYRPGPMDLIPDFIKGKHKKITPKYLHPSLEPILSSTYGIAVYQEQVMEIARKLAGFSLGEGYLLIKAVSKKIRSLLIEQREKFIKGCRSNDISQDVAEKVFNFIEPFAEYGFNRAHAVCYAMIAYQTAYLKANYMPEFMAALMRSDEDNVDRLSIEIAECQRLGLKVLPPSINESDKHFAVVELNDPKIAAKKGIRFGLAGIKNLGSDAVKTLLADRKKNGPFKSLTDLVQRADPSALNKKSLEALMQSGALDEFGERASMIASVPEIHHFAKIVNQNKDNGQQGLFMGNLSKQVEPVLTLQEVPPASILQQLKWEKTLLGLYISQQPLEEHKTLIEKAANPIGSLGQTNINKRVKIVGMISHIQKVMTRSNETMLFIQLDDFSGNIEALIFPSVFKDYASLFEEDSVLILQGKVSDKDGTLKILADNVERFSPEKLNVARPAEEPAPNPNYGPPPVASAPTTIARPEGALELMLESAFSADKLSLLKSTLEKLPNGETKVYLRIKDSSGDKLVQTNYSISKDPATLKQLADIVGTEHISG